MTSQLDHKIDLKDWRNINRPIFRGKKMIKHIETLLKNDLSCATAVTNQVRRVQCMPCIFMALKAPLLLKSLSVRKTVLLFKEKSQIQGYISAKNQINVLRSHKHS